MKTNFREQLNIPNLRATLNFKGVADERQQKAIHNIKWCANTQWEHVNSWYDCRDEYARELMMSPRKLFAMIYNDSLENYYSEGSISTGRRAQMYMKDIRFCGREFLQKVAFYFTVELLEECVPEVEGTDEDIARVANELKEIKAELQIG